MIRTFNQFIGWYVDRLTLDEVKAALNDVGIEVNKLKNNVGDELKNAWKKGPKKLKTAISAVFDKQHIEAREEIKGKSRPECRDELDSLVTKFGIKSMAFVFIVNPDKFMNEIGYELVNERGNEVELPEDVGGEGLSEVDDEVTEDGNHNCDFEIVNQLEEIAEVLHGKQVAEDLEQIDAAINRMLESWQEFKEHLTQREKYSAEIKKHLKQLHKYSTILDYLQISGFPFPLNIELYESVEPSDFVVVKGLLNDINEICQETRLLQPKKEKRIDADRENWKRLIYLGEQFEQKQETLGNILKLPERPKKVEQLKQTEHSQELDNEGNIEPEEEPESLECLKESPSVSEADEESGDIKHDIVSNENEENSTSKWFESSDVQSIEEEKIPEEKQVVAVADEEDSVSQQPAESSTLTVEPTPTIPARTAHSRTVSSEPEEPRTAVADAVKTTAAAIAKSTITPEQQDTGTVFSDAESCFWEAFQNGDFATTYWLTREVEDNPVEKGVLPPAPSWLLLSIFLGREASWDNIEEKDHLYNICMEHSDHLDALSERIGISERDLALLLATAALRPTLFAPETLASTWVEKALSLVNSTDSFFALMQTVLDFSSLGKSLDRKLLRQAFNNVNWQEQARSISDEVAVWRNEVSSKRITFWPATMVLRTLAGPEGIISSALDTVIKNDFNKQDIVADIVNEFFASRKSMNELVAQTTQALYKRKARGVPVIDGQALQQIIRLLGQLRQLLIKWLDSVQIGDSYVQKNDWWYNKTQKFHKTFEVCWRVFEPELIDYSEQEVDIKGKAIRTYVLDTINILLDELTKPLSEMELKHESDWEQMLSRPLLLLSGAPLGEEGYIDINKPFILEDSLLQAVLDKRSLKDALRVHLEHYDFQLAEFIICALQDDNEPQTAELYQEYEELESRAAIYLKDKVACTRDQIVQATIDHVLIEEDRARLEGQLLSIEQLETKRLSLLFQELDEITEQIKKLRTARHESLLENMKQLSSEIDDRVAISGEQNNLDIAKRHLQRSKNALENEDLPLADEFLHYAERAIDTGMEYEVEEESDKIKYVEEFVGVLNELYRYLESENNLCPRGLVELLAKGKSIAGLDMKRVPGARCKEIRSGLDAWLKIKRCKNIKNKASLLGEYLEKLLEYAGFQRPQVEYKNGDNKSAHFEARMSAGKLSPLADFGSQRSGVYDVVLVSSRPHAETIGNILHAYGVFSTCPIVIFTGRMTVLQRREWSNYCRKEGLTALLIDELLLYYLASQRESRLPAFISCGAAWGYLIPYRSFGVIPPETFKGRTLMVKELGDPGGSCIVYGGRQFGKTAILHMVQREYDNPERGFYVIYDDIKPLGDPHGHYRPEDLWNRLRGILIDRNILYKGVSHERGDISQKIIDKLINNKNMRVVVLLDECDYFLAADAENNFEEVHELRRIMDHTERRFKVVFCGLHSVQRYCSGQNHPFAQMMSQPLVIGPLEPRDALSLITEPMEATGFSFNEEESRNAVLRILCYANYHPALIQYFCGELIKLVRKRQQEPPYKVTIADVEGIYRREDVRSFMRERFNWTLDLDSRYQGMIYSMIVEQLHEQDGYRREFTVSEALKCAKFWWQQGFAAMSMDEAKALLDELIGLGVLIKRINGMYRLKNGNIVRALGSEQEIKERLDNIGQLPAPDTVDDASYRLKLNNQVRSPLTVKQANELSRSRSGVGLVFGSEATGIIDVPNTLKLLGGSDFSDRCQQIPPDIVTLDQLLRLFSDSISRKQAGCGIFYTFARDISIFDASLVNIIRETSRFLSRYSGRSSILRWILIFDAFSTRKWFEDFPEDWEEVEGHVDAVAYLMRWDQKMIKKYFDDLNIPATDPIVKEIYNVTGGWPYLLSKLWELMKDPANDRNSLKSTELLKEKLANNVDGIADGFLDSLGVNEVECGLELIKVFKDLGPLHFNEIDEGIKTFGDVKLRELCQEKVRASLLTLHRLNVLFESDNGLEVEHVVSGGIGK